ncbi:CoA ligase [Dyella tabacisoli]|uniref:CoA ligase n=2 Tax=Dyella tabacisoli TaxID=2282381 RepID=A0A369UTS7_9GAMM|nr:CoA ligase [Dyella tabacisoli]
MNRWREKSCFIGPAGDISYARLDAEVRRAASALLLLGVVAGDRVAIAMDDSPELAVIFFASLAMGAMPVVLNPSMDTDALTYVLRDCAPIRLFGKSSRVEVSRLACEAAGKIAHTCVDAAGMRDFSAWQPLGAGVTWDAYVRSEKQHPVCIQYTSGTSGMPKGVVHSAGNILAACEQFASRQLGLKTDDVLYSVPKTFFGYGMGNSLFFPLYLGATALLDSRWPTIDSVVENLRGCRPNVFFAVPTIYRMLLDSPLQADECAVRLAFSAGAPLSEVISRAWSARFGFPLHDGIGATELCHVFATTYPDAAGAGSIGRIVGDWQTAIVDADGQTVAVGEVGVLLVKASSAALGYWSKRDASYRQFADSLLGPGWYRTGDLFSQDLSGRLYFHGREDDRFKIFGRWVVPVEIENTLARHAPELGDTYLVSAQDAAGELRSVLFLHAGQGGFDQGGFEVMASTAADILEQHFDRYQRPAFYLALKTMPLTANNKPNRRALSALATQMLGSSEAVPAELEA